MSFPLTDDALLQRLRVVLLEGLLLLTYLGSWMRPWRQVCSVSRQRRSSVQPLHQQGTPWRTTLPSTAPGQLLPSFVSLILKYLHVLHSFKTVDLALAGLVHHCSHSVSFEDVCPWLGYLRALF